VTEVSQNGVERQDEAGQLQGAEVWREGTQGNVKCAAYGFRLRAHAMKRCSMKPKSIRAQAFEVCRAFR